jgi:hypothetical protein
MRWTASWPPRRSSCASQAQSEHGAHSGTPVLGLLEVLAGRLFRFVLPDPGLLAGLSDVITGQHEYHRVVARASVPKGGLLPVEQIYAAMMQGVGFRNVQCRPIRMSGSREFQRVRN